ncbi:MAG TPA: hypothetical protein IAB01_02625 [Candidatus Avidesulfovibrio excrementigallinarum]|nr:hypothetical protein [Candidatus Avidesulfovibrio excrementigallinarum]
MMNDVERQRMAAGMDAGGGVYDVDAIAALLARGRTPGSVPGAAFGRSVDRAMDRAIGNALDTAIDLAADGGPDSLAENGGPGGSACGGSDPEEGPGDDIPMPAGWDCALWQRLGPEVRAAINAGEQSHAQAMARARAERQAERQLQDAFAVAANAQIQQALTTMKHIVEGEYSAVDWQGLAQSDPAAYVRLQQACNARMAAIRRIQQGVEQQTRLYEARRAALARQAVADEFAVVQPEIRAMLGAAFNGRQFAEDVAAYMHEQGCPAEVINNLSKGYELKLVAKAMLYDRLKAQRAAAARKVAQAPAVQSPRGAFAEGAPDRVKKARALLGKNPNSTDALAALFEATL